MAKRTVLLLCGDFMEDYEAMVPFLALQAYGVAVDAVCPGKNSGEFCRTSIHYSTGHQTYSESLGHSFMLNATFDEIEFSNYDGLLIPGGRAPEYLAVNESVIDFVRRFSESGKPIAAICHALLILAAADVVNGRRCTAYPSLRPVLLDAGASWVQPESFTDCVVDGNLITAVTFDGHPEFIRLFLKALGGTITNSSKRVLFLCGDYMEDYEIRVPFQSLQALGCHVDAVCPNKHVGEACVTVIHDFDDDQTYTEKPGYKFALTATLDDDGLDASSYDALVIPGGRAAAYLALNQQFIIMVKEFMTSRKPTASIGHGLQILAAAGALMGRKCTAHRTVKPNVVLAGGTWLEPEPLHRCFTDGNLVTGAAWPALAEFVSQLMALLGISISF